MRLKNFGIAKLAIAEETYIRNNSLQDIYYSKNLNNNNITKNKIVLFETHYG